ncbi:MAG: double-cubane-cluster-containing anaerobic reductase [Eubacteriales bacterium]|nr:double-cubane-cluster-containing anaerobic reductase [Eubacteriales bacterium]
MELIKNLPEVFADFAEQRQKSFLSIKALKEKGTPVIGVFCTYLPQEIPMAMGAAAVSLCSTSDETIPDAELVLPRNLCPLIKSSYGFAKTDKCPFFYFSDLVVGETTCDGKKKMYEYLAEIKPVHVMELPNRQTEDGVQFYRKEIIRFKEALEKQFGVTITQEQVKAAVALKNREREALKRLYGLMKMDPAPMKGMELLGVLTGIQFKFDKEEAIQELHAMSHKIQEEYAAGKHLDKMPRILVTGSPISGAASKVVKAIEDNGGVVVAFENCSGAKAVEELVDETNPDVYEALSRKYMNIGCSCMSPNPNRMELLRRMLREYQVDAVVDVALQACHTYNIETVGVKRLVTEEFQIPYINLEADYSSSDIGQLNTRMAAFLEML